MNLRLLLRPSRHSILSAMVLTWAVVDTSVSAAAGPPVHPFTIARTTGALIGPAISGHLVVWVSARRQPHSKLRNVVLGDVYAKDLRTGKLLRLTTRSTAVADPLASEGVAGFIAASDLVVVWGDCRNCRDVAGLGGVSGMDLYARSLRSGREIRLPGGYAAAVSGKLVFWADCCRARRHLYVTDAVSGHTRPLTTGGRPNGLSTDGRTLVYADDGDIYGRRVPSGRQYVVARHQGSEYLADPHISGDLVIWMRLGLPDGSAVVQAKNVRTGRMFSIARVPQRRYFGWTDPQTAIGGTVVLWDQARHDLGPKGAAFEIRGLDLYDGRRFVIGAAGPGAGNPGISGKIAVWRTVRLRGTEVRGAVLSTAAPTGSGSDTATHS